MKYKITVDWSGYSRGYAVYEVEAETEEEAREIYWENDPVEHVTVRDDTEREIRNVEKSE